jgi:hypothetical protein
MILLEPAVFALTAASFACLAIFVWASSFGWRVVREWDINNSSERQLGMERKTSLVSTLLVFVFGIQLAGLLLFVYNAERMSALFAGAMCAVGSLNVNAFGWPALVLKVAVFFLSFSWLILNHADSLGYDYPLTRIKYRLLMFIVPLAAIESLLQLRYFLGLDTDVITSCCGSLFGESKQSLASDVSSFTPASSMSVFYTVMAITIASGVLFYLRNSAAYLFAAMSILAFIVSIVAIISFVSLYQYEHPHHHCPFCVLKSEYDYRGYLLYIPLFGATAMSLGALVLYPFRNTPSLKMFILALSRRLSLVATGLFMFFTLLVSYIVLSSNLRLFGG